MASRAWAETSRAILPAHQLVQLRDVTTGPEGYRDLGCHLVLMYGIKQA
jgi:hypothetical protein